MSAPPSKPTGSRAWNACIACAVVLFLISFSPLVLSPGEPSPALFGVPRTLWLGMLVYAALVACTWIGTRVHPDNGSNEDPEA